MSSGHYLLQGRSFPPVWHGPPDKAGHVYAAQHYRPDVDDDVGRAVAGHAQGRGDARA